MGTLFWESVSSLQGIVWSTYLGSALYGWAIINVWSKQNRRIFCYSLVIEYLWEEGIGRNTMWLGSLKEPMAGKVVRTILRPCLR